MKLPNQQPVTAIETNDLGAGRMIARKEKKKNLILFPLIIKGLLQTGPEIKMLLSAWPLLPREQQRELPAAFATCI